MVKFSETYLFKVHALSNALDNVFGQALRKHADLTLSQFVLLLAISEAKTINQRTAAKFLGISPAAINRQADLAKKSRLIEIKKDVSGRGDALVLTKLGESAIEKGSAVLDKHVFSIFDEENIHTTLMDHIDMLLTNTKTATAVLSNSKPIRGTKL